METPPFKIATIVVAALAAILVFFIIFYNVLHVKASNAQSQVNQVNPIYKSIAKVKNLTSEYIYNGKNQYVATIDAVNSISTSAKLYNGIINLTIAYNGTFGFIYYNCTPYLKETIGLYYFGIKLNNWTFALPSSPDFYNYFSVISNRTTLTVPQSFNPRNYMQENVYLVPSNASKGKVWQFCGGFFLTYANSTYASKFNALASNMLYADNASVINKLGSCSSIYIPN